MIDREEGVCVGSDMKGGRVCQSEAIGSGRIVIGGYKQIQYTFVVQTVVSFYYMIIYV